MMKKKTMQLLSSMKMMMMISLITIRNLPIPKRARVNVSRLGNPQKEIIHPAGVPVAFEKSVVLTMMMMNKMMKMTKISCWIHDRRDQTEQRYLKDNSRLKIIIILVREIGLSQLKRDQSIIIRL